MEVQRAPHHRLHGRALALPNHSVLSGHPGYFRQRLCILLDDQIPPGVVYSIRFELLLKGETHVVTTVARSTYGVYANSGGLRVGLAFKDEEPKRAGLIKSLAENSQRLTPQTTDRIYRPALEATRLISRAPPA